MMRRCKQCGESKPLTEANYRKYYGEGRKGFYRVCLSCEKINTRHKYLGKKQVLSGNEEEELAKIEKLYDVLRVRGLQPPEKKKTLSIVDQVDAMLLKHETAIASMPSEVAVDTPEELLEWLNKDLSDFEPEYLQDEIYDMLKEKYMPVLGLDPNTNLPKHDETHWPVIDKIGGRFDEYEDNYYQKS